MDRTTGAVYEFGVYRLEVARRSLLREGKGLPLAPKTFDLLVLLVESRGRVLTKKELIAALWPDSFVEEANLSFQMHALRKALGEKGAEWIENLPRYGYRFNGDVTLAEPEAPRTIHTAHENGHAIEVPAPVLPPGALAPVILPSVVHPPAAGPEVPQLRQEPARQMRAAMRWPVLALAMVAAGAVIALIAGAASLLVFRSAKPSAPRSVQFLVVPPAMVSIPDVESISLAPDGSRLAFIGEGSDGKRQLWIRPLDSLVAEPLAGTELVNAAFWSADGNSIAFFASGKLKKIELRSGTQENICDCAAGRGSWSQSGAILFDGTGDPEIYRISAGGGKAVRATELNPANQELLHSSPQFLPDGTHFIYLVQSTRPENNGIYVASLKEKRGRRLIRTNTNAVYAGSSSGAGYVLFTRGTDLMAQALDLRKLSLTGEPLLVTHRVVIGLQRGLGRAAMSASRNGVLAYRTRVETGSTELVWLDRQGKRLGSIGQPADYSNPALSRDERKLAVSRAEPQNMARDLWLVDLNNQAHSRFTFDPADETNPVWSPDGDAIAYSIVRKAAVDVYVKNSAGAAEPRHLLTSGRNNQVEDWSPDGRFVLFRTENQTWALPADGGTPLGPYAMEYPRISPNGRWVAYTSDESGRSEVSVQSFPPGQAKWQVSAFGGTEPYWRSDGKELYYIGGDKLMAVDVKTDVPFFEAGLSRPLFEVRLESTRRRSRYQVAGNGKRILVNLPIESSSPITVNINWTGAK